MYCNCSLFSSVFEDIERYAPGFQASVLGRDILTPPDLDRIFGLTGGVCTQCTQSNATVVKGVNGFMDTQFCIFLLKADLKMLCIDTQWICFMCEMLIHNLNLKPRLARICITLWWRKFKFSEVLCLVPRCHSTIYINSNLYHNTQNHL